LDETVGDASPSLSTDAMSDSTNVKLSSQAPFELPAANIS